MNDQEKKSNRKVKAVVAAASVGAAGVAAVSIATGSDDTRSKGETEISTHLTSSVEPEVIQETIISPSGSSQIGQSVNSLNSNDDIHTDESLVVHIKERLNSFIQTIQKI